MPIRPMGIGLDLEARRKHFSRIARQARSSI